MTHIPSIQFQYFPEDILFNVFSYLGVKDLCRLSCVSRRFYNLSNDEYLWRGKLILDSVRWKSLGSEANPELYRLRYKNEMSSKEIYLRCYPEFQSYFHSNSFTIADVFIRLKALFYKRVPKVALIGPGLESGTSCFVTNIMSDTALNPLRIVKIFPGYAGGIGSGFTFALKKDDQSFARHFDLSIIYSTTKSERSQGSVDKRRLYDNKLFDSSHNDGARLTRQASDFFLSMDALVYAVDTHTRDSWPWDLARDELYAITQHMWVRPHIPILVLALAIDDSGGGCESSGRRMSCCDIIDSLRLNSLNGTWQVINSTIMNLGKVDEAFKWVLNNCRA